MTVIAIYRYIYSLSSRQTWLYAGSTPRDKLSSLGFAKCLEGLIHIRYHQNQTPEMSAKTRRFEPVEQSMGGTENEPGLADEHLRGIRRMPETPPSTQKRIDELVAELEGLSINQLGYPTNQCFDYSPLFRFLELSVNNVGDPFHDSNFRINTHEIEREVIAKFADLMRLAPEETWGYVTSGGTEGNMYGLYMAREMFPNGIVYFSQDTHYSVLKNLRVLNYRNIMIKSQPNGEIDYDDLRETIRINRDVPVVVFANIGTTMKGAVDNLDKIRQILEDFAIPHSYIHADAALSGMILPFVDDPQPFGFDSGIDSVSVSGHKVIGSPIPSGIVLTKSEYVARVARSIEYVGAMDTTLSGSRNAITPLMLWYAFEHYGMEGFRGLVADMLETAQYAVDRFNEFGIPAWRNKNSITVVFPRPADEIIRKWQMAPYEDFAHIITVTNVTREKIDAAIADCLAHPRN